MAAETILETQSMPARAGDGSYIDWPAIVAGALLATAITFVLLTFGSGLGLSLTSPFPNEGISIFWLTIATALWILWVEVSSFMAGAYLTGRMRRRLHDGTPDEVEVRDGAHGLAVWALGVLLGAVIAFSGIAGATRTAIDAASSAAPAAVEAAAGETDGISLAIDRAIRADGASATNRVSDALRDEMLRLYGSVLTGTEISAADRDYLANSISRQAGVSIEDANSRVAVMDARAQELLETARTTAEKARTTGILATFLLAASLMVSAAAAYFSAVFGGRHRDEGTVIKYWGSIGRPVVVRQPITR